MAEVKPLKLSGGIITELASGDTIPAANVPVAGLGVPRLYAVTIRDCDNTASLTDVIEASIPANDWADGEKIVIEWVATFRNLAGGSPTLAIRVYYGSSYVNLATADGVGSGLAQIPYRIELWRVGSEIWIPGWDYSQGFAAVWHGGAINAVTGADQFGSGKRGGILTSQAFNSTKAVKIAAQWSGAGSGRFYTVKGARICKI